ncbi:MAG: response regulator transcription factor [Bacilli bacterium]|nr:response regulator transcription factor [Bacilli bacterium]
MINFIICDDVKKYREMIKHVIDKFMMKSDFEYKTYEYTDYDDEFLNVINTRLSYKVYILDIEAPSRTGIDVARIIRRKDKNSVIIFLTGHEELVANVSRNNFLFLSFINKFDDCENHLYETLGEALKVFDVKMKLEFKDSGVQYAIPLDDILYVTRDSIDRKCVIVTDYSVFRVNKTLGEIESELNDNFVKTHRACFVNKRRIISFDKSSRIVIFDNGSKCDLVSTRFDKELV